MRRIEQLGSRSLSDLAGEWYAVEPNTGCWLWLSSISPKGYPLMRAEGRTTRAYRTFYEHAVGVIPSDKELDHLCRTRCCVNPDHMEPVSHQENINRGRGAKRETCSKGHPVTGSNVMIRTGERNGRGTRCRICYLAHQQAYNQRRRMRQGRPTDGNGELFRT